MNFIKLILLLSLTNCGYSSHIVYIYGDSIDLGMINPKDYVFTSLIANNLEKSYINKSVGSTTLFSDNQYRLIMTDDTNEDLVIFDPGVNDAALYKQDQTYLVRYRSGLQSILQHWSQNHTSVYLITPLTVLPGSPSAVNVTNADIAVYAQISRDLVLEQNDKHIKLLDFNRTWIPTEQNTLDGLHPNIIGNMMLFNLFLGVQND